jgi:hypothetical protein
MNPMLLAALTLAALAWTALLSPAAAQGCPPLAPAETALPPLEPAEVAA